jgi:hypothetical protein
MGTDFGHLTSTKKSSAEYTFWDVVGEPKLVVRHAGESNKPYFNEMLRRAEQLQKRKARVSAELIRDHRDRDRDLFPKFVVSGWKDVNDAAGKPVTFTKEDCEAFLRALDDDTFDALREFCKDASNFRETVTGDVTAGNSQTA